MHSEVITEMESQIHLNFPGQKWSDKVNLKYIHLNMKLCAVFFQNFKIMQKQDEMGL